MKVAFVHDWLLGMRGGEKVLEAACELFPGSDIYTLLHDPARVSERINRSPIHTSWLQRLPGIKRYYRYLLPIMPLAIREFDLSRYDLVLSFSHCVAKGACLDGAGASGTRPVHVCYCFTPMRYIYYQFDNYFSDGSKGLAKWGARIFRPYLVRWDRKTTRGVDHFIACGENVKRRIQSTYGRGSEVIYPPVDTEFFTPSPPPSPQRGEGAKKTSREAYYLAAGALVPYKRVDLAIEACRRLNVPLKIVGVGTEENRLKALARGAPVEFLGWRSGAELRELYRNCEALLFPQEEDFGIAAVEAMACGRPVIAYKAGGALETVVEGNTGLLFDAQAPEALADAIRKSQKMAFDPQAIRAHAEKFNQSNFKKQLTEFIQKAMREGRGEAKIRVMEVVECGGNGGTGYQVAALCNGLDKNRFDVSLVYAVRPGSTPEEYEKLASGAGRRIHIPEMVREITPLSDMKAFRRLYRIFREQKPDVVHAHSSKAGFLARVAGWLAGVPHVYYSPRGYSFLQTDRSPSSRKFYRSLERFVSNFGETVAVADSEAVLARNLRAQRVRVVRDAYLGSIPDSSENGKVRGETVVCAAGRISFPRNPEAFVRLSQRLTDSRNGLRCVWIGGGELQPRMDEMIRDMNLSGKLQVTGWLAHGQALHQLQTGDIFIHYSRWEGLPNAVLEAMAYGLPVIASDIPGNRDLIRNGENGFLVNSEVELLERALELVDHPELRKTLGAKGRELVRSEFSLPRMLGEISSLYAGTSR